MTSLSVILFLRMFASRDVLKAVSSCNRNCASKLSVSSLSANWPSCAIVCDGATCCREGESRSPPGEKAIDPDWATSGFDAENRSSRNDRPEFKVVSAWWKSRFGVYLYMGAGAPVW